MSDPYIGEIRILPYPRGAPNGWQKCDGTLLSISEYETLYVLLGTTYGGNGVTTFGVPDLRGAVPIHQGHGAGLSSYVLGQKGGAETVTLTLSQMAQHTHSVMASGTAASSANPTGAVTAALASEPFYASVASGTTTTNFPTNTISAAGGNQPHANIAPTLAVNYCIATAGIFPSQQ